MNTVRARVWRFRLERSVDVVAKVVGVGDLPVGLARLVHVNAMACDLRRVLDYRTKQLEVRLLVSYLDAPGGGIPLQLDHHAFAASSRHIRGFVSECSGLGMLTAASETLFAWHDGTHALHSFDALPKQLLQHYDGKGVRPDLLFHLPGGPIAGEARGRYRPAKTVLPTKLLGPQKGRLRELAAWSASHSDHPYFMSWFYIGPAGVAVDIFLPEDGRWDRALATGWAEEGQGEGQEHTFPLSEERPGRRPQSRPSERDVPARTEDEQEYTSSRSEEPPGPSSQGRPSERDVQGQAEDEQAEDWEDWGMGDAEPPPRVVEPGPPPQEQAETVVEGLYESAPAFAPDSALADIPVRGSWADADALGPARHEVFLGVLAERLPRQVDVRERMARAEGRFDACLDGRLLTVVRPLAAPRPEWHELERVLLGDR